VVAIDNRERIYICTMKGKPIEKYVKDLYELERVLTAREQQINTMFILTDPYTPHGIVKNVMEYAQRKQIENLFLATVDTKKAIGFNLLIPWDPSLRKKLSIIHVMTPAEGESEGLVVLNDKLMSISEVYDSLRMAPPEVKNILIIQAEHQVPNERIVRVMDSAKRAGIGKIGYARAKGKVHTILYFITSPKFVLFQNFPYLPNASNPETWIPYQLAESAPVTIQIYRGSQLIRTLDLGKQKAGIYVTKGKAAYWDGRDGSSEQVASGMYFYTLQAGEFSARRKFSIIANDLMK